MKMTEEEIKQKRDEIAKAYGLDLFPIQNIETRKDFTQDINFARRMTHTKAYQHGFDIGFAIGLEQAKVLVEALEFYAEFSNWYGEIKHRGNNKFTDFSRTDLEQFEGHMICGKKAREALQLFKERVEHE